LSLDTIPQVESARATRRSTGRRKQGTRRPASFNGPLFRRDRNCAVAEAPGHRGGIAGYRFWGYPYVEVLYKTKERDGLQQFSRQFGMKWRIFYFQGFHEKHFTCLKPGERIL